MPAAPGLRAINDRYRDELGVGQAALACLVVLAVRRLDGKALTFRSTLDTFLLAEEGFTARQALSELERLSYARNAGKVVQAAQWSITDLGLRNVMGWAGWELPARGAAE